MNFDLLKMTTKYMQGKVNSMFGIKVIASRLFEAKDQNIVIKGLTLLPENYKLNLIGSVNLKPISEKLAVELGTIHRVHFLGIRSDIPQLSAASDIVIQSFKWEGFGCSRRNGVRKTCNSIKCS